MTQLQVNAWAAYVLAGAGVVLGIATVVRLVFVEMIFWRLRRYHSAYYKSVGEPSLIWNNSITKGYGMGRYVLDKEYRDVTDPRAHWLGDRAYQLFWVSVWGFGVFVAAFAVMVMTY